MTTKCLKMSQEYTYISLKVLSTYLRKKNFITNSKSTVYTMQTPSNFYKEVNLQQFPRQLGNLSQWRDGLYKILT